MWNDANANGIIDPEEDGLTGVHILLEQDGDLAGGLSPLETWTGSLGEYTFDELAPGQYTVQVETPAGYVATTATEQMIDLEAGASENVDFGLRETRSLWLPLILRQ